MAQLVYKMSNDCFVLNGVVWKLLGANLQHRFVLLVPQHLIKQILSKAHGHFLSGHFGILKMKHRLLQSYYCPNMEKDISEHLNLCNKCQVTKGGKMSPELLLPLPKCTEPNQRVHADLFGPLKTLEGDKKFIVHNRCVYQICGTGNDTQQRGIYCRDCNFKSLDLSIWPSPGNCDWPM